MRTIAMCVALMACGGDDGSVDAARSDSNIMSDFLPTGASLVFAAIGDFGDTSDLSDGETETLGVANLIKSWDPGFILTVGDNDYTDGEFEGTNRGLELGVGQYFHDYIGDYMGTSGPGAAENMFFPVPGDHDYGDDCDNPRLGDYLTYFTLPETEGDETYYQVRRGPVEVFAIDSIVDCHQDGGAKLAQEQAWLMASAAASDATYKIAYFHHPPHSSGRRHGSAEHMQWPFEDYGIDLVLSGDDHIYERVERAGVVYLVIGLGGVDRHRVGTPVEGSQVQYSAEYGALGLAVMPGELQVAFINVSGETVDAFSIVP